MAQQQCFDDSVCLLWLILPEKHTTLVEREAHEHRVEAFRVNQNSGRAPVWTRRFSSVVCYALEAASGEYSGGMGALATQAAISKIPGGKIKPKVGAHQYKSWETSCLKTVTFLQALLNETWVIIFLDPGYSVSSGNPEKAKRMHAGDVSADAFLHWQYGQASLIGDAARRVEETFFELFPRNRIGD